MKKRILIFATFLLMVATFSLFLMKDEQAKAGENDKLRGWGWSPAVGNWLSLNCHNSYNGVTEDHCSSPAVDYGVDLNESGLVGSWQFEEGVDTKTKDFVGGHHGELNANVSFTSAGRVGKGIVLNDGGRVGVTDWTFDCSRQCTIIAWVRTKGDNQKFYISPLLGKYKDIIKDNLTISDTWTMQTYVIDRDQLRYVSNDAYADDGDGNQIDTTVSYPIEETPGSIDTMWFGSINDEDAYLGSIDNVQIFDRALTSDEISFIYSTTDTANLSFLMGTIDKYAYSPYVGWFCFGQTCLNDSAIDPDPGSPPAVDYSPAMYVDQYGSLRGWGDWLVLNKGAANNKGWTRFRGDSLGAGPFADKKACHNCFGDVCGICFNDDTNGGRGNIFTRCTECTGTAGTLMTCAKCAYGYAYGVGYDKANYTLFGFAWNPNINNYGGFGWLEFLSDTNLAYNAYLKTEAGDIYAKKGINSTFAPPAGITNATYLLQIGESETDANITNFNSTGEWAEPSRTNIDFPNISSNYYSNIGKLDLRGILAGNYGAVQILNSEITSIPAKLGGAVYYRSGNYRFESPKAFLFNNPANANGTIVLRGGDLYVNADITYTDSNSSYYKQKSMASLGVLVLKGADGKGGNVYIAPGVKNIVGSYYAEGKIFTCSRGENQEGTPDECKANQLKVNGLLIASGFDFKRTFTDPATKAPSELITYDRRVILNPPPGFTDIAKAMPDWQK